MPKNPFTGGDAKSNDTSTWSDFHTAVNAVKKYNFDGIGIQLADGIFGIDLDGVVKDGKFSKVALDIIHTMDSYTEYSPSGTGIHILCKGTIPPKDRRNGNVEMYSEGRFFTVTGKVLGSKNLLQERTAQAKEVHKKYISRVTKSKENQSALPPTDTELL
ncbi:MAG: DNA primase, partial [Clostridiales bacterium]|nr:DNA primase [Clostridiales bacterium]